VPTPPLQITKKQHYVPQFYLRQWVDNEGGFYPIKIEQDEPPVLKIFKNKSGPSSFCYENFFYAQKTGVKDEVSQLFEEKFAEIEAIFSNELPAIEKKIVNNEQITELDKYRLSECMLFLHFRGKKYRHDAEKMTDKLMKQMFQHRVQYMDKDPKFEADMKKHGLTKEKMIEFVNGEQYTVSLGNIQHLKIMDDIEGFCNLLTAKYWKVYISRRSEFITTDNPYLDKALSNTFWGNDFLSREQVFILSPRVVIVARYPHDKNGKKFSRKDITNDKGKVQILNTHVLMNSIKFGFHKDKTLLEELDHCVHFLYENKKPPQR